MDLNLQPLARTCFVSGESFNEGDRVASYLVRSQSLEIVRYDLLEAHAAEFAPEGFVACRWVHVFKPRARQENAERELKLTAESLFTTLADPATEREEQNEGLIQFLALMLERKRLLRPKGKSADGRYRLYEHAKTKLVYQVEAGEMTPEFFLSIQEKIGILVGSPKVAEAAPEAVPAPSAAHATVIKLESDGTYNRPTDPSLIR